VSGSGIMAKRVVVDA
nr:RecName: Full=Large ribosomal subunit protein uL13; AltName: Full=60S ribosomal protein L13a [Spinacia oleracea]